MFSSGTDSCTQWPYSRWETEPYYEEGADAIATGKSYTCHGGFVSQDQITQFDNVFFGIDETEARAMVPAQKMSMEVGYECLVASGFNSKNLKGRWEQTSGCGLYGLDFTRSYQIQRDKSYL